MKLTLLILSLLVAMQSKTWACVNEYRVLLNGKTRISDMERLVPHGHPFNDDIPYYTKKLKELDSLWKADKKIEDYSDYGVLLVYLGQYHEAKKVFIDIEKQKPGLYATAANLGTTYELLGQNELALEWIKKAVKIDPASHDGSEWLHVKILEAKIGGEKFINSDFLISTGFGNDTLPWSKLDSIDLIKLRDAVYYQLNERVSFVKPKDKIVALLLFELGNITAITDDVNTAFKNYEAAIAYGFKSDILNMRQIKFAKMMAEMDEHIKKPVKYARGGFSINYINIVIGVCIAVVIVFFLFLARKMKKSKE